MSHARVFIGVKNGVPMFRIGPAGQNVLDVPEKDLLFTEKYRRNKLILKGAGGVGISGPGLENFAPTSYPEPFTYQVTKTFSPALNQLPEVDLGRYHTVTDSIRLPVRGAGGTGSGQPFEQCNLRAEATVNYLKIGILDGDYQMSSPNATYTYGSGRIGWAVWENS